MSTKELGMTEKIAHNKKIDKENRELITLYRETDDNEYREEFFRKNQRLAPYIAHRYTNTGIDIDDLISLASFGMMKAFDTFNLETDTRFVTYSATCMNNEILMAIRKKKRENNPVSMDESIAMDDTGSELTLADRLVSPTSGDFEALSTRSAINYLLEQIRGELKEREQIILDNMLLGEEKLKQREMAEKFGITQSYVARIERKISVRAKEIAFQVDMGELTKFNTSYEKPRGYATSRLYVKPEIEESPVITYTKEPEPMEQQAPKVELPKGTVKEQVMYLMDNHPNMSVDDMAKAINRSNAVIYTYRSSIRKERADRAEQDKALAKSLYRGAEMHASTSEPIQVKLPESVINALAPQEEAVFVPVPAPPSPPKTLELALNDVQGAQLHKLLIEMVLNGIGKDTRYNTTILLERIAE